MRDRLTKTNCFMRDGVKVNLFACWGEDKKIPHGNAGTPNNFKHKRECKC